MKKKGLYLLISIIFVLLSVNLISSENAEKALLINACSNVIKNRMKSPETYTIENSLFVIRSAREDEKRKFASQTNVKVLAESVIDGTINYRVASTMINYLANNSFNSSIRGEAICVYNVLGQPSSDHASYNLSILSFNGKVVENDILQDEIVSRRETLHRSIYKNKFRYLIYQFKQII